MSNFSPNRFHSLAFIFTLTCLLLPSPTLAAQDDDEDDEDLAATPGLVAIYEAKAARVHRNDPDVTGVWNHSPDQRLPAGPFTATWSSNLLVQRSGSYQFDAVISGSVEVEVGGKVVLRGGSRANRVEGKPVELTFGDQPFVVRYASNQDGTGELKLFWSSEAFQREPIPAHLFSHEQPIEELKLANHAGTLHNAYRCARCHASAAMADTDPAPSLTHIKSGLSEDWIVSKLLEKPKPGDHSKMPSFGFDKQDATAITAFLLSKAQKPKLKKAPKSKDLKADQLAGRNLVQTIGCLACHQLEEIGSSGPYSGGSLDDLNKKRSTDWIHTWLANPGALNPDHRMPVINLSKDERRQLAQFLGGSSVPNPKPAAADQIELGEKLVRSAGCANCHRIPGMDAVSIENISVADRAGSDGSSTCLAPSATHKGPNYSQLAMELREPILAWQNSVQQPPTSYHAGEQLLARRNCTACHQRDGGQGILPVVGQLVAADSSLRSQSQGLIPPSLNAVGDKLKDHALREAISGKQSSRLPWLSVRMPQFKHTDEEANAIVSYLVDHDRIPTETKQDTSTTINTQTLVEGQTLIGATGFSCIACHKAGKYEPRNIALGTRGSDLLMPGKRMRKEYFLRWVRSPTRIIPGMEMPSITKPVKGVLGDDIHHQLTAAWDSLNDKNFTVPTNPGSVEQFVRVEPKAPARIIRDVFTDPAGKGYVARPLVIGLNTGHNLMFDLDQFGLRHWWFGDVARQRTEGKSWYWDVAGIKVASQESDSDIVLRSPDGELIKPMIQRATAGKLLSWERNRQGVVFSYNLNFRIDDEDKVIRVTESVKPYEQSERLAGWIRQIDVSDPPKGHEFLLRHFELEDVETFTEGDTIRIADNSYVQFATKGGHRCTVAFSSGLSRADSKSEPQPGLIADKDQITSVPGFRGNRLPLPASIMPTSMTWRRDGTFVFTSLKGHVYLAVDSDGDDLPDKLTVFEEGLAAPFGILRAVPAGHAGANNDLLVAHKPEIIRLSGRERAEKRSVIATGWGYSDNYHDWTCGLVRDSKGHMYFGLGSDYSQPKRAKDRSLWRGAVLRTADGSGGVEPVSWSFRYPVGFAIDSKDRVFVTDNQGVQNTFNEVNHVQMGKHYGVPSMHEPNPDQPETTPAIRVPHPWVRSMNGIVFLPKGHRSGFGDHLIGCEYDTHMLIRMSFQDVGDVVQGASYYFSKPGLEGGGNNFVGPICAAVHENGDIYVGSIHDSGWLGGRNTGAIERIRFNDNLPNGIRELRATPDGFEIDLIHSLPADKLGDPKNYSISGYTRNWKGSYATPDSGRHTLNITKANVTNEGRTVRLTVEQELRKEHVYEVTVNAAKDLFPATGHYTMKRVPH